MFKYAFVLKAALVAAFVTPQFWMMAFCAILVD